MKRILFLLLLTVSVYGQNPSRFAKIQITGNSNSGTATKVNVQEANGEVNTQTINTGFNKNFGLNSGDVVGANTLLNQYSTTPVDWTATTFDSWQVVFYGGKQWIAKMATVAGDVPAVSPKWEEITFEALANKTVTVDQTIIDGSTNAVSGNAVFDGLALKSNIGHTHVASQITDLSKASVGLGNVDNTSDLSKPLSTATINALATKAPISSVHNPVTLGTANGLSLATQQLSLGLASSGVTGALSGTDWNTFNNKQPTITGLTTNYLPKWNGSGFGNSSVFDNGGNVGIGTNAPSSKLEVAGSIRSVMADAYPAIGATNYGSVGFPLVHLQNIKNGVSKAWNIENGRIVNGDLGFYNEGGQRVTFTNNGRVLINKTDDDLTNQLQVAGTISASPAVNSNQVVIKSQLDAYLPLSGGDLSGSLTINSTFIRYRTSGIDAALISSSKYIDVGSSTDFNTYVYGNNPYGIWTNGVKRVTVGGDGNATFSGTISASPATTANQVVVKSQLDAVAARPYKVYTALISQTGTNAPTIIVLENTLGATISMTRQSTGHYRTTISTGNFPANRTFKFIQNGNYTITKQQILTAAVQVSTAAFDMYTEVDGVKADDVLMNAAYEIRIYP